MFSSAPGTAAVSTPFAGVRAANAPGIDPAGARARAARRRRLGVRTVALGYLALLLLAPVLMIF